MEAAIRTVLSDPKLALLLAAAAATKTQSPPTSTASSAAPVYIPLPPARPGDALPAYTLLPQAPPATAFAASAVYAQAPQPQQQSIVAHLTITGRQYESDLLSDVTRFIALHIAQPHARIRARFGTLEHAQQGIRACKQFLVCSECVYGQKVLDACKFFPAIDSEFFARAQAWLTQRAYSPPAGSPLVAVEQRVFIEHEVPGFRFLLDANTKALVQAARLGKPETLCISYPNREFDVSLECVSEQPLSTADAELLYRTYSPNHNNHRRVDTRFRFNIYDVVLSCVDIPGGRRGAAASHCAMSIEFVDAFYQYRADVAGYVEFARNFMQNIQAIQAIMAK